MGKSTVVSALREQIGPAGLFDADACVAELLTRPAICAKIAAEFGSSVLDQDGLVDRPSLRGQVFDNAERRAALEGILHPEVRREFVEARDAPDDGAALLIADIPLLFESGHDYQPDLVLVVASDPASQLERLMSRPGIDRQMAASMVAAQLPIEEKIASADHVIWNAGSREQLHEQVNCFAKWLKIKTIN